MIKRLVDEQGSNQTEQRLADLFRSAAPVLSDPFVRRRVLARIEGGGMRRARRIWLQTAAVAALLISGSAAAAVGHHYVGGVSGLLGWVDTHLPAKGSAQRTASTPVKANAHSLQASSTEASSTEASSTEASSTEASSTEAAGALVNSAVAAPADTKVEMRSALKSGARNASRTRPDTNEDAMMMVDAIQALRTAHNPARARSLLSGYLSSRPHGVLAGDALALSIEASSAEHDPAAADYARRYLQLFPNGKYRQLAEHALASRP